MKAIAYTDGEGPESLHLTDLPDPEAGPGEVLIDIAAAGVNRADLLQVQGLYPVPEGGPASPGLECAGRIAAVGEGVTHPAVGDEVCALLTGGGYATRVAVPAGQVMPIPGGLAATDAAALPEVACTVWSNLVMTGGLGRGRLAADATWGDEPLGPPRVLLHGGAGGIGSHAIQLCRALGARVATTCGSPGKAAHCRELGAELAIEYRETDFVDAVREWTDDDARGTGVDLVLDVMGAKYLGRNVSALAPDGRVLVIGMQGGVRGELDLAALLARRGGVLATNLRNRPATGPGGKAGVCAEVREHVWPLVAEGRVRPTVTTQLPLAEAGRALALLASGDSHGKIVLTTGTAADGG